MHARVNSPTLSYRHMEMRTAQRLLLLALLLFVLAQFGLFTRSWQEPCPGAPPSAAQEQLRRNLTQPMESAPLSNNRTATRLHVISPDGVPGANPGNRGRLRAMRRAWNARCPDEPVEFVLCPGLVHPVQGHGLSIAYI